MSGLLWCTLCLTLLQDGPSNSNDGVRPRGSAAVSGLQDPYSGNPAASNAYDAPGPSSIYDRLGTAGDTGSTLPPTAAPANSQPAASAAIRSTLGQSPGASSTGGGGYGVPRGGHPDAGAGDSIGGSSSIGSGASFNDSTLRTGNPYPPSVNDSPLGPNRAAQPTLATIDDVSARDMVAAVFSSEVAWEIPGRPITMETALQASSDSTTRLQIIRAYWKMSRAIADGRLAGYQRAIAKQPAATATGYAVPLFQALLADSEAQVQSARLRALEAQRELARWINTPTNAPASALPLPTDAPLVGAYYTRFEQVFAGRAATAEARQINEHLPEMHQLVALRGDAALAFNEASQGSLAAFASGRESAANAAGLIQRTQEANTAFLDALYYYNDRIARYAMEAGGSIDTTRAVAMLLHRRAAALPHAADVQTASATSPVTPADQRPSLSIIR